MVFFGCQPGQKTLDGTRTAPGNPFATAFLTTLAEQGLPIKEFVDHLYARTKAESRGYQLVDAPRALAPDDVVLAADGNERSRVALVLVVSAYQQTRQLPSLEGAAYDARRIAAALAASGYRTTLVLDDAPSVIDERLSAFRQASAVADVALIYTTGHGLEVDGEPYVLMRHFDFEDGKGSLQSRALKVSAIAEAAKSATANLVFSAACRNNPTDW